MQFGQTLAKSVYEPWKEQYLDYTKLKRLLREDGTRDDDRPWTEEDESRFCDEILNTQLGKVAAFQELTFQRLEQHATNIGDRLRNLAPQGGNNADYAKFKEIEDELEGITNEVNELKKYSAINYTGFLKIAKKHDRKRGSRYKVRPMLQFNLSKRPFNSEQAYTPIINKLSIMYLIIRQNLEDADKGFPNVGNRRTSSTVDMQLQAPTAEKYTAYKFWIHLDNLLEVKTYILRRLPVLVYSKQSANQVDTSQRDPTLTSLYFDNSQFSLYTQKVDGTVDASSLRIRWYGKLNDNPELLLEQKITHDMGSSEEMRFPIKEKYIQSFINGEYKMEKNVQKLVKQDLPEEKVTDYQRSVSEIQEFIKSKNLQPVLRANYTRTAFQKPLDDRVRISIDTELVFIREDSLDLNRPCRSPDSWHRTDIDNTQMEFPFQNVNQGEISRFPFAVLDIKVKESFGKKTPQWIQDLMASHLVHKAPRFSKFVHGVASLFEDYVNSLPFWLSDLETDIRKDPHAAFAEEELAKAQKAEDELLVGSYMGSASNRKSSHKAALGSPISKSYMTDRLASESAMKSQTMAEATSKDKGKGKGKVQTDKNGDQNTKDISSGYGTISSVFPSFSLSRYARSRRQHKAALPPGVTKPGLLIKDSGPLQVEPKVWLANERTFLKWQHLCILLSALAISLYTAAGEDKLAEYMGIAYIVIAAFAGSWGYYIHFVRRKMIIARSGKDFDNFVGPMVVSVALLVALLLNIGLKYHVALKRLNEIGHGIDITTSDTKNISRSVYSDPAR